MSIFAFICPYQLLTLKRKVTFHHLFFHPGPFAHMDPVFKRKNGLEIRFLFPEIFNKYKRSIFFGTPCMLTVLTNIRSTKVLHHASCIIHHRLLLNKVEGGDLVC